MPDDTDTPKPADVLADLMKTLRAATVVSAHPALTALVSEFAALRSRVDAAEAEVGRARAAVETLSRIAKHYEDGDMISHAHIAFMVGDALADYRATTSPSAPASPAEGGGT